jgi:hypothetical protein
MQNRIRQHNNVFSEYQAEICVSLLESKWKYVAKKLAIYTAIKNRSR